MVFLRSPFSAELPPMLRHGAVVLRVPQAADYQSWAGLRLESRRFLTPWEPSWPHDDLTRLAFRARIKRYLRDIANDAAYPYFLFAAEGGQLVGALTLSNVRRGAAQMASLGYWIGEPFARAGFMSAGVAAILPFAFESLRLHRIEAACLPANVASIALLRKSGFGEEGYARKFLRINGQWEDHLLFSRLAGETPSQTR